ncbi:hypothetical protein LSAT2_032007 [Lamellibrachia satsuma]|nr:hypothetical protein LSAT2_032007 [Lamellibrachia satsuma]
MYRGKFKAFSDFKKAEIRYKNWRERAFLPDMPEQIRRVHRNIMIDCYGPTNAVYGSFYRDRERPTPPRYDIVADHYDEEAFVCNRSEFPRVLPPQKQDYSVNYLWRRNDVNELQLPDVVNVDMQIHTRHGEMSEMLRSAEGKAYLLNTPVKHVSLRGADIKTINLEFSNKDKSVFHLSATPVDYDCGHIWRN